MEEQSNKKSSPGTNGYISSNETFTDPYAWIDGLEEDDEELLDEEVRKIFSLTDVDFETARKRNSVDFFLLDNELENITHNLKEYEMEEETSLKKVSEAFFGGSSSTCENHDGNNNGQRKEYNCTGEVNKNYFLMSQTENVSSPIDTTNTKPNLNVMSRGEYNNYTACGTIPVIITHSASSPESDMGERHHETNQKLMANMGSSSLSRSSTPDPITLLYRSRSFKEIKEGFEAKIHAAEVPEKLPLTPRKMMVQKPENTEDEDTPEQFLLNQEVDCVDPHPAPPKLDPFRNQYFDLFHELLPSSHLKEADQSSADEVESEATLELSQITLDKEWAQPESDEESEDTVVEEDESSADTSDDDDKEDSDQEESDIPLSDYVERLIRAEQSFSDTSSDASCSSDAVVRRIASKVLKKMRMKYRLEAESSSSSDENSEDDESEHKVEKSVIRRFKKNVIRNARDKVRVERESKVHSSKEDIENFNDEVSVVSDSPSEDDLSEDNSSTLSNTESEDAKSDSERSDILQSYNLQDAQDALSETDESVIYQSYDLEEQSGRAIVYHEKTPNLRYAKSSPWKTARSRSLPDHLSKEPMRKQVSFDEDPEIIPSPELPRKGIPITLEERLVSDLRWPFTNFYVKEVQEDRDDSHLTESQQYSGVLPCYKSKLPSSSFPGRKKDVMLGRVWWVEWWAGNEHTEEEIPTLTSVQSTESL